ncbi:3'5'-cyclic nucleotide phosphodiesterase, partial [Kipferlia bialata]|eukprot:g11028.t1
MAMAMLERNPAVFGDMEMFALILAAASHDVQHPGVDNKFLVRTEEDIAIRFNDRSVLENHHAQIGWGLIKDSGVADHFRGVDFRMLRQLYIDLVIETDPSTNFDFTRRNVTLDRVVHTLEWDSVDGALAVFKQSQVEKTVASTRFTLLALVVKLADLSNPFRPRCVSEVYAECIMREFFKQGDRELVYDHAVILPPHQ